MNERSNQQTLGITHAHAHAHTHKIPLILLRSIDASSLIPIPFLMILNEPSLPAPEHVISCRDHVIPQHCSSKLSGMKVLKEAHYYYNKLHVFPLKKNHIISFF